MSAVRIYRGCVFIAEVDAVEWSIHGVGRALASVLTRPEYRRVFRGPGMLVTAFGALVETRNDDGSGGPTYSLIWRA